MLENDIDAIEADAAKEIADAVEFARREPAVRRSLAALGTCTGVCNAPAYRRSGLTPRFAAKGRRGRPLDFDLEIDAIEQRCRNPAAVAPRRHEQVLDVHVADDLVRVAFLGHGVAAVAEAAHFGQGDTDDGGRGGGCRTADRGAATRHGESGDILDRTLH